MYNLLDLFKCVLVTEDQERSTNIFPDYSMVTDFVPTKEQETYLKGYYGQIRLHYLFTKEELLEGSPEELITKQIMSYMDTYVFGEKVFDLEIMSDGYAATEVNFIHGITRDELTELVQKKIYANAPFKNVEQLLALIREYSIQYDYDKVQNNELRAALYTKGCKVKSADELVRIIIYVTTHQGMLIKNKETFSNIRAGVARLDTTFLEDNERELATVFNRYKPIFLSLKCHGLHKNAVNRISRLSKILHKPLKQSPAKTFLADFIANRAPDVSALSARDIFKLLQLSAYKKKGIDIDVFNIRNGKAWVQKDRETVDTKVLCLLEDVLLRALGDLVDLKGKRVLVDTHVDYGLPVSRKQTIGNIPFGTKITMENDQVSVGIYWKNEWGSRDLDLSAVNLNGERIGWGSYSAYDQQKDLMFSGDMTNADPFATEFVTSVGRDYGLFVNNYSNIPNAGFELLIGEAITEWSHPHYNQSIHTDPWISNVYVREKANMTSNFMSLGFVTGKVFNVFSVRLGSQIANFNPNTAIIQAGLSMGDWSVNKVLEKLGAVLVTEGEADFDLTYAGFTYDKLEAMFGLEGKL